MSEHTLFAIALFIFIFCVECIFVADYRSCMKKQQFEQPAVEDPNQSRSSKVMLSTADMHSLTKSIVDRECFVEVNNHQTMPFKQQANDIYGGFETSLFLDKKGKPLTGAAIAARRQRLEKLQKLEQLLLLKKDMIDTTV
jgi:hypothetical protein